MGELFDAAKEVLKVSIDQKQSDFIERIYEALKQGKKHLEIQMGDCSEAYVKMFAKWLSDEGFSATHGSESPRPPMILFRLCVNLEGFYTQVENVAPQRVKYNPPSDISAMAKSYTDVKNLFFKFPQKSETHRIPGAAGCRIELCPVNLTGGGPRLFIENVDYDLEVDGKDIVVRPTLNTRIVGSVQATLVREIFSRQPENDKTPDHAYPGEWDLDRERDCIFKFSEKGTFRLIGAANAERITIQKFEPGDPAEFVPGRDYRCTRDGDDFIVFKPSESTIPKDCELIAYIVEPEA